MVCYLVWKGPFCPRCQHGTLGKLAPQRQGGPPKHRCNAKNCQAYISPHYAHPLFVDHWGKSHTPLSTQAALLLLLLNRVPHAAIHRLMYVNHKAIEDMQKRLYTLREAYVLEKEKEICFGRGHEWADVEADEATFAKKIVQGQVQWEQWCGIVQRGKPGTLVLHRLKPPLAALRAPGPGAVRKVEWKPIAKKWLEGKNVILHTDSAKSYRAQVPGMLHDRIVHKKTRVKVGNKFRWVAPKYVEVQKHRLPGGKVMQVKSGTQIVDRCWRFLKERVTLNQQACVGARMLCMQLRSGPVRVLESRKRPVDMHRRTCTVVSGVDYRVRACDGQKKGCFFSSLYRGSYCGCRGLRRTVGKCHSLPQYNVMPQQLHPFESTLPKGVKHVNHVVRAKYLL